MNKIARYCTNIGGGVLFLLFLLSLSSCSDLGYYARCTKGHLDILSKREPIACVLESKDVAPQVKANLEKILKIRDFASQTLGLPENGSYRSYADVERPYALWNVVAAPEFDLEPKKWCFPVAGCVNYRGFFSKEEAGKFAAALQKQGYDVYLYGVSAYSTLGWFDDPVLNTFLNRSEPDLAGLIFHELAHQKIYVKGDSVFSESFAKAVELEGVSRWLKQEGKGELASWYLQKKEKEEDFLHLIAKAQEELASLYRRPLREARMQSAKDKIFRQLLSDYRELKRAWGGYSGYDQWFSSSLNNAKLASVATYRTYVPAFRALLRRSKGNFQIFYQKVGEIANLDPAQKIARLEDLRQEYQAQNVAAAHLGSDLPSEESIPVSSPSPEG